MLFKPALFLAMVITLTIARPNPSSSKTIASAGTGLKSLIKSPSQKLAEKNNAQPAVVNPAVSTIVEPEVSQSESVSSTNLQSTGQDADALQYSNSLVSPAKSKVVETSDKDVPPAASAFSEPKLVEKETVVHSPVVVSDAQPVVVQPAVVNPEVPLSAQPTVVQPAVVQPAVVQPEVPLSAQPSMVSQPEVHNKVVEKEAVVHSPLVVSDAQPVVVQPEAPLSAQPTVVQPAVVQPETPLSAQPTVVQPTVVQPAVVNPEVPLSAQPSMVSQPEVHNKVVEKEAVVHSPPVVSDAQPAVVQPAVVPPASESQPEVLAKSADVVPPEVSSLSQPSVVKSEVPSLSQPTVVQPVVEKETVVHSPEVGREKSEDKAAPILSTHPSEKPIEKFVNSQRETLYERRSTGINKSAVNEAKFEVNNPVDVVQPASA